ncbi:dTDP-4-dehydrorhamnose 3,5-epimerase [Aestuariispira insulae]|uniref:dTDP-4-dehydrorhamnose 3,5-epimerase n=1 Tax=Aestuariispira insulae TaxID=1461337 RepID=A0A3D9HMT2_9PROT|nr:dTDP-4-dehydrorhamnose 3,5-epimerase [Aestuariispira insulae]RED50817.1 dTDP-4-dehydrorhamnose 3,5-epimerase [Aestuariispira insulae]
MDIKETAIEGCFILEPSPLRDDRGFFARSYCPNLLAQAGLSYPFQVCQENISFNERRGTLRGMHWQAAPVPDPKIIRAVKGALFDVVIDIRPQSKSYGKWVSAELTADNRKSLIVPPECAHGFLTLEDQTEAHYLMGAFYEADLARGLRWNDPAFGVKWPFEPSVISERDASYPDHAQKV